MPPTFPISNNALVATMVQPSTNWGQVMAAKDAQLQQQAYLTQSAEQQVLQEQQASAQIANFQQRIRALPLERPDKQRVNRWLVGQEKSIADRLEKQYNGSLAKFMAAEGAQWMQHTLGALEQSEEYQTGIQNLEHITNAKEALQRGETLVGKVISENGKQRYVSANEQLTNYYAGKSPNFRFSGAYKDDDDLLKHFGSQYAPGKLPYEQTPVSEEDKLNYLVSSNTPEIAMDKYFQKYQRAKVFYKTKPLDEYQDYLDKRQDQKVDMQMKAEQFKGTQLSNAIKTKKLAGLSKAEAEGNDPGAYLRRMIPQSAPQTGVAFEEGGNKILPISGYDLNLFGGKTTGKVSFNAIDVLDKQGAEALGNLVGAEKVTATDKNPSGWRGGRIQEGIVDKNGFNAIDLSGTKHRVVKVEPKIYTNPREFGSSGAPISPNGPTGFLKVTVQFDDNAEAKKAGLLEGMFNSATRVGAGAYDKDSHEITIYTPIGHIYKNAALNRYLSVQDAGQKVTNDFMNPFSLGLDDD